MSVKKGLCLGEFLVAASLGEWGQRCTGETIWFSAFWTSSVLGIFFFPPRLFASQTTESCPIPKGAPKGASIAPQQEVGSSPWRGGRGQLGQQGCLPTPTPPSLPAALLFSLAQATGCDACFLLLVQTQGRGPKGMVGFA